MRFGFSSVSLYSRPFSSCGPILRRAPNDPQITLACQRSKVSNVHSTGTPGVQLSVHVALRSAIFELRTNFETNAPNHPKMTLTCPWSKQLYTATTPKFRPFLSVTLWSSSIFLTSFVRCGGVIKMAIHIIKCGTIRDKWTNNQGHIPKFHV